MSKSQWQLIPGFGGESDLPRINIQDNLDGANALVALRGAFPKLTTQQTLMASIAAEVAADKAVVAARKTLEEWQTKVAGVEKEIAATRKRLADLADQKSEKEHWKKMTYGDVIALVRRVDEESEDKAKTLQAGQATLEVAKGHVQDAQRSLEAATAAANAAIIQSRLQAAEQRHAKAAAQIPDALAELLDAMLTSRAELNILRPLSEQAPKPKPPVETIVTQNKLTRSEVTITRTSEPASERPARQAPLTIASGAPNIAAPTFRK